MAERLRILFVDDEPRVLEGLSRLLRPLRQEWDVAFVDSGVAALGHVQQRAVDVVVSDMRMPGMDGVELLERIAVACPTAARIALSGYAEQELLLRAVGPAHQWLAKPCELARLRIAVERSVRLRMLVASPSVRALTSKLTVLPTPPVVYQRMTAMLRRERATIPQIAQLVEQDAAVVARLLQITNSAAFGAHRSISSIAEAIQVIGVEATRSLVLSAHLFNTHAMCSTVGISLDWMWQHGLAVATAARAIARTQNQPNEMADACFSAGLLHDCGMLLLLSSVPAEFDRACVLHRTEHIPLIQAEQRILHTDHAHVGAYLLDLWGLPDQLVEATAFHHGPEFTQTVGFSPLTAVHVADALLPDNMPDVVAHLNMEWLHSLGYTERVRDWRSAVEHISLNA
jgi:HD-like signal output (HDOD) protein